MHYNHVEYDKSSFPTLIYRPGELFAYGMGSDVLILSVRASAQDPVVYRFVNLLNGAIYSDNVVSGMAGGCTQEQVNSLVPCPDLLTPLGFCFVTVKKDRGPLEGTKFTEKEQGTFKTLGRTPVVKMHRIDMQGNENAAPGIRENFVPNAIKVKDDEIRLLGDRCRTLEDRLSALLMGKSPANEDVGHTLSDELHASDPKIVREVSDIVEKMCASPDFHGARLTSNPALRALHHAIDDVFDYLNSPNTKE